MSNKTDGAGRVISKEIDVKRGGGGEPKKSIGEQQNERLAAIRQDKKDREKPRRDFLAGKGGEGSDHFDIDSNADEIESFTGKAVHEEVEDLSESAREKWLRTGELPEKKPNGKAAAKKEEPQAAKPPDRPKIADFQKDGQIDQEGYEAALDRYEADKSAFEKEQSAKPNGEEQTEEQKQHDAKLDELAARGEIDKELYEEVAKKRDWWNEEGHAELHKTMPERTVAGIKALSPQEKNIIARSPVRTMQLDAEFDGFLGHAMARVKNLGRIHLELARDPALVKRMNEDWIKSKYDPKFRWATEKTIRYMLQLWDKKAASAGSGAKPNGAERQLTRAGKPPSEAAGASSSPRDDGSSDAAWRRKDLSMEERGELYRERKNQEEVDAKRRKYARPRR